MKEDLKILMLRVRIMSTTVDNCLGEDTCVGATYLKEEGWGSRTVPVDTSRQGSNESNSR